MGPLTRRARSLQNRRVTGPLADLSVIEVSGPIGQYTGRLLADLGADVIKVEPPEGDPVRRWDPFLPTVDAPENSLDFLLLNANKRGICLDLSASDGREGLSRLVAAADILIESWRPGEAPEGFEHEQLSRLRPDLIRASITGWGLSGPRAGWAYSDMIGVAAAGVMAQSGFPGQPPERLGDVQGYRSAAIAAAAGILTALHHRDLSGEGQQVEVSMQEAMSIAQQNALPTADILGFSIKRRGENPRLGFVMPGLGTYECEDGHVFAMLGGVGSGIAGLVDFMEETDEAGELRVAPLAEFISGTLAAGRITAVMQDPAQAGDAEPLLEQIDVVVRRFMRNHTKQYLYEEGQRRRISIGMVSTPADLSKNPQLAARDWFTRVDDPGRGVELRYPGQPWLLGASTASIRRPAPLLGEHDAEIERELAAAPARTTAAPPASNEGNGTRVAKRPLEGLKVLDLSWFGAGPIAARALALAGAEVIRVETEKRPDGLRIGSPRPPGAEGYNVSGYFNNFNNEKRSVTIDLTTERGHELGLGLVRWADIFLTNMTNRAIEQIGLTPDVVIEANPKIIALYQSMQGLDGPHQGFLGFGAVLCAIGGAFYTMGSEHRAPTGPGSYPDFSINPMHATVALLAALRHRRNTGEGQLIDMSQLESSVAAMAMPLFAYDNAGLEHRREGNRVPWAAPHGAFQVLGEDRWVAIACDTEPRWQAFAAACGHPEWADDPRFTTLADRKSNEDALEALVAEWAVTQDEVAAVECLQAVDVPATVVQEALDVLNDDHLAARGYFVYPEHAEAGRRAHDGPAWSLSRTPVEIRGPSPLLGEHTYEVCSEVLGLSSDEIAELLLEKVLV